MNAADQATQWAHGGDRKSEAIKIDNINLDFPEKAPPGNTRAAALRRLRTQAPELHQRVLAGELSAHAAAVEAGFRHRTITIPVDPEGFARAAARHFSAEDLARLEDLIRTAREAITPSAIPAAGGEGA